MSHRLCCDPDFTGHCSTPKNSSGLFYVCNVKRLGICSYLVATFVTVELDKLSIPASLCDSVA